MELLGGKYVLGDRVGEGGMGVVYRAEQPALARTVAIKLLRRELASDPHITAHFRAEALAAARLAHPNLVTVIDYGETVEGVPFLVMEYVDGPTLGELMRNGGMTIGRAVALVRQLLGGLAEAHAAGVVHADVKCENILVETGHDGFERVKLVDFGLARIKRRLRDSDRELPRFISGTPEYMAPEVIRGEEPTIASDLYSVGVILYELLTGSPPFSGGTPDEIMERHLHDVVVPPSLRSPGRDVPAAIERAVARALAKPPDERFPDAEAFDLALDLAHPADDVLPIPRTCRRCGAQVASAAHHCTSCGADLGTGPLPIPVGPVDVTGVWRSRDLAQAAVAVPPHAAADHSTADELRVRKQIGDAIVDGAVDQVADGYLELAALLCRRSQLHAAIHELEEGIDLLTAGAGPAGAHGSASRLVAALLPLYDNLEDPRHAYAAAADRWRTLTLTTDLR